MCPQRSWATQRLPHQFLLWNNIWPPPILFPNTTVLVWISPFLTGHTGGGVRQVNIICSICFHSLGFQKSFLCLAAGSEFLIPVRGFYCLLCKLFYGDAICAEEHNLTHSHNEKYKVFTRAASFKPPVNPRISHFYFLLRFTTKQHRLDFLFYLQLGMGWWSSLRYRYVAVVKRHCVETILFLSSSYSYPMAAHRGAAAWSSEQSYTWQSFL